MKLITAIIEGYLERPFSAGIAAGHRLVVKGF
jgi:hypothetical protein